MAASSDITLAIETSNPSAWTPTSPAKPGVVVAASNGQTLLARADIDPQAVHQDQLMSSIAAAMSVAGIAPRQLSTVAVSVGCGVPRCEWPWLAVGLGGGIGRSGGGFLGGGRGFFPGRLALRGLIGPALDHPDFEQVAHEHSRLGFLVRLEFSGGHRPRRAGRQSWSCRGWGGVVPAAAGGERGGGGAVGGGNGVAAAKPVGTGATAAGRLTDPAPRRSTSTRCTPSRRTTA
ncbi:MAG: hypothetical protein NTV94_15740 [Planctomycetota bacterium]|nr:hypothetical protein [Planctomycetota bacterium]